MSSACTNCSTGRYGTAASTPDATQLYLWHWKVRYHYRTMNQMPAHRPLGMFEMQLVQVLAACAYEDESRKELAMSIGRWTHREQKKSRRLQ